MENLAENLKNYRDQYGYTQQQIADKLNISQSTYAGYETGKSTPDIKTLWRLADLYGTQLDLLVGRYIKS